LTPRKRPSNVDGNLQAMAPDRLDGVRSIGAIMKRIPAIPGCAGVALTGGLALLAAGGIAASPKETVSCPYLETRDLTFDVPATFGDLPAIDFDYPSKVTIFSFREGHLLLVAMDEDQPSRLRIVISAQLNQASGTYDGQILVDMGGHELQVHAGPVACTVGR
jgi:hypothetical protein